MIPEKRSPVVEIPITFENASKPQGLTNDKFVLSLLVFGLWIFVSILSFFTNAEISGKVFFVIASFIVMTVIVRFLLLRENYFKKKREELVDRNFQYPHSVFWNIYEVSNAYPYICKYANGLKSIFVVFDKDVIIGRDSDADYYHYEAISDAYMQMHKRGIDCVHIDYMDTVGKDSRVQGLFEMAKESENEDLTDILTRIFDNVEYIMQHSYASYDVYCFFYAGKDELFMDELEIVLDAFLEANYIRYRVLDKNAIGELVKSVFNIDEFSVRETSERLFTDLGGTHYLRPIWVERETSRGVERVVIQKTRAEEEKQRDVMQARREMIRSRNKKINKRDLDYVIEDLDLEEDNMDYSQNGGYMSDYNNEIYNSYNQQYNPYENSYDGQSFNNRAGQNSQMDGTQNFITQRKDFDFDDDEILE